MDPTIVRFKAGEVEVHTDMNGEVRGSKAVEYLMRVLNLTIPSLHSLWPTWLPSYC